MNSPAVPARATLLRSRARADALYRLLPQAARSLMAREKQMPLSASLVFLSCSLYSTIGLKGNTVNGMTFKPIQIWYYSSLVASWEQISRLRENLLPGNYEGSAISWAKGAAKQRKTSKMRFREWNGAVNCQNITPGFPAPDNIVSGKNAFLRLRTP